MGLCKCPKRRVTNLFCFVHRVNVCEDCMVTQHPRCVVQSYLKWLEDSDYDAVCVLCSKSVQEGEVVRLACYDLFHLSCLDKYAHSLPQNTAPAGFRCPKCKEALFPPVNMVSPVVNRLREELQTCSWAREGLGGQLVGDEGERVLKPPYEDDLDSTDIDFSSPITSTPRANHTLSTSTLSPLHHPTPSPSHITVQMYDHPVIRGGGSLPVRGEGGRGAGSDSDENKYRRKNPLEMLSRWIKPHQRWTLSMDDSTVLIRRYLVVAMLAVFAMVTVIVLMTQVGRGVAERDRNLDWRANPNVRTGD